MLVTNGSVRRFRTLSVLTIVLLLLNAVLVPEAGNAGEALLPPETEIVTAINHYVSAHLAKNAVTPVAPADEATLLRRTTLDLAGRIPYAAERDWFLSLPEVDRRRLLVERLMQSPDFSFHHRNWLDETLLPNQPYQDEFRNYLLTAVQGRRSWDTIFRELMKAGVAEGPEKGVAQFLKSRVRELDDLTNDTAILFFGVNISCAKCHDHPLVSDWKQDHFYGMQAFFQRTYQTRKVNALAERPFGEVKFTTTGGEEKKAAFMFLTGDQVTDRTPEFAAEERKSLEERIRKLEQDDVEAEIFIPEFRPRDELVEIALHDSKDRFFARNIVNRVWARLLGTGIVDPLDQMHSGNPPSHPELLEWLADDLVSHGYDLRRLIQGIVLSEAYARSSEWSQPSEMPTTSLFAVAKTRPLTPRQLAASLHVAVRNPQQWPSIDATEEWIKRRADLENQANGWVREFEQPGDNFQVAVDEALFFSNSQRIQTIGCWEHSRRTRTRIRGLNSCGSLFWGEYHRLTKLPRRTTGWIVFRRKRTKPKLSCSGRYSPDPSFDLITSCTAPSFRAQIHRHSHLIMTCGLKLSPFSPAGEKVADRPDEGAFEECSVLNRAPSPPARRRRIRDPKRKPGDQINRASH